MNERKHLLLWVEVDKISQGADLHEVRLEGIQEGMVGRGGRLGWPETTGKPLM